MKHKSLVSLFAVVLIVCMLAGCTPASAVPPTAVPPTDTPAPTPTPMPPTPTPVPFEGLTEWDVVVIGDSSLWGVAEPYGRLVEQDRGVKVTVHDNWIGGLKAGTILKALRGDSEGSLTRKKWPQLIEDAEVVVVWGNPEDSVSSELIENLYLCLNAPILTASRQPEGCTAGAFEPFKAELGAIYDEIAKLHQGRPLIVRGSDLYNPLISLWREQGIDEACRVCWEGMSTAARQAAEEHGVTFVSVYDAFNGPNHDEDPRTKGFIREDGEHTTEAGAQLYAETLRASGYAYAELPGS